MLISNLSLRQRLLASFGVVASVTILCGVSGLVALQRISGKVQKTSAQVSRTVAHQMTQTHRILELRDTLYQIDHAVDLRDLQQIDFDSRLADALHHGQWQQLEDLYKAKQAEIAARDALNQWEDAFNRQLKSLRNAAAQVATPALRADILELNLVIQKILTAASADAFAAFQSTAEALCDTVSSNLERHAEGIFRDDVVRETDALRRDLPRLVEAKSRHIAAGERFQQISGALFDEVTKLSHAVVAVADHLDASVNDQLAVNQLNTQTLISAFVGILVITFFLSIGIGMGMARSISTSINTVVSQAEVVADGDLTQSISSRRNDEIGVLASHFNVMLRNLKEMLGHVQNTALQITSTSQEIQVINEAQASGATEQSSAVSQTSQAASQLSQSSEQIGENIKTISQMANHVLTGMENIKQATDQTHGIMMSLNEKSKQIGNIIELIDDVADQTNLLAVNASIEAARAGEQGRGFTVVADQISKLADSTAKSTKDITSLIEMIQHEMSNAIVAMDQSLSGVEEEIRFAKDSATKSQEIAVSANQQIQGSRQIAEAMAGIDRTMNNIVAGAKRSAEAALILTGMADELKESMSRFKVNKHADIQ